MKRFLALVILFSLAAVAQDKAPTGGRPSAERTETPTRGVIKYKAIERALLQAQQEKQQDKISAMLADDFEVWSSEQNEPTPRELLAQHPPGLDEQAAVDRLGRHLKSLLARVGLGKPSRDLLRRPIKCQLLGNAPS